MEYYTKYTIKKLIFSKQFYIEKEVRIYVYQPSTFLRGRDHMCDRRGTGASQHIIIHIIQIYRRAGKLLYNHVIFHTRPFT